MRKIQTVIALALAALWLPAVWHCGMEALEQSAESVACCDHEADTTAAAEGACVADHCDIFDQGHVRADGEVLELGAPVALSASVVLALVRRATEVDSLPTTCAGVHPPPELAATWVFVQRAAPWANAPGTTVG